MSALSQLNAIRAFEAVARYGSYARAARELHVTPAAVGQQVRALEQWLGQKLFQRLESGPARLVLTVRAKLAAFEFRQGLAAIERGVEQLRSSRSDSVTVTASTAFVGKWLMSRLERFTMRHPAIELRINVSDRLVDLSQGEADVGIRCGPGHWPNLAVTLLMREAVFPVCSPALLRGSAAGSDIAALGLPLIDDQMTASTGAFPTWDQWLGAAGTTFASGRRRVLGINSSLAAIDAAIAGHGVLLARGVLVRDEIHRGLLTRVGPPLSLRSKWSYYLVRRKAAEADPGVAAFSAWIRRESRRAVRGERIDAG